MQRTVHGTNVIYGVPYYDEERKLSYFQEKIYKSTEKDKNKALKDFRKKHPYDAVIRCEPFSELYVLDDEIFFNFAKVVTDKDENTATDEQ